MFTRNGKGLTAKGVKPICSFQQVFKSLYLFGAYSPITGEHFELELPTCNTETFQLFLDHFSEINPDEFKIILLDNGKFHKGKDLVIPKNIKLLFIPPYSPELNPCEKIWHKFKRQFSGKLFKTLDNVSEFITTQVNSLSRKDVQSICGFEYIINSSFWTIIY